MAELAVALAEDLVLVGRCLTCHQWAELDPGSGRCPLCPWEPAGVRYRRARARQRAAYVFLRDGVLFAVLLALLMLEVVVLGGLLFPGEMT